MLSIFRKYGRFLVCALLCLGSIGCYDYDDGGGGEFVCEGQADQMTWRVSDTGALEVTFTANPEFPVSFVVVHYKYVEESTFDAHNYFLKSDGEYWSYTTRDLRAGELEYYFTYCATDDMQKTTEIYRYNFAAGCDPVSPPPIF